MGERSHHHQSRLGGLRSNGGEIVEVQEGGRILKSIGRKDRHSKVCTAKGPRDRRVRLAAHTAIQFYDVQDRLGYDRPSKAVDWLIKKAKTAIDELEELPAWNPTACSDPNASFEQEEAHERVKFGDEQQRELHQANLVISNVSSKRVMTVLGSEDEQQDLHQRGNMNNQNEQNLTFLPTSLDTGSFADSITSFPMGASAQSSSLSMEFQGFPIPNFLPRNSSHNQDLRLSLQSFQDPVLLHHHHNQQRHQDPNNHTEQAQVLLSGIPLVFDGTNDWPEHQQHLAELIRLQRLSAWNTGGDPGNASGGAATVATRSLFNSPPSPQPLLRQLLGQSQNFSQRGPLQSSNTPSIRAWMDPSAISMAPAEHIQQHHHYPAVVPMYPGIGFASGVGSFSGFCIPARIRGDVEEHDGRSDKPSSAPSDSHR